MMWGRWQTFPAAEVKDPRGSVPSLVELLPVEKDRRERARIVTDGGAAIFFSAPIFNVGEGDPCEQIENLASLGPDVLPAEGKFNRAEFRRRLLLPEHLEATIGAALLNQRILAGLGNYLRAEVLFECRLNPWRKIRELKEVELRCLARTAPELSLRSYLSNATAGEVDRARMRSDASLTYQPDREYGTRHMVFRRTNLPCLRCGELIRQKRQATFTSEQSDVDMEAGEQERTRIVYFCPKCQKVDQ